MGGLKGRQGRELPLEGLVEVVGGRKRTRRLNRRGRRHLASESSVLPDHRLEMMGRKAVVSHRSTRTGVGQRTALLRRLQGQRLTISWSHCAPVYPKRTVMLG